MRRDGLKPVQPHNPKIYQPYLWDNISVFGVLKISKLKAKFACLRISMSVETKWYPIKIFKIFNFSPKLLCHFKYQKRSRVASLHLKPFCKFCETAECLPSRCGCRDEWMIVLWPLWQPSWGPSIRRASWNIRSWLTRLWSGSLASLCWFFPS